MNKNIKARKLACLDNLCQSDNTNPWAMSEGIHGQDEGLVDTTVVLSIDAAEDRENTVHTQRNKTTIKPAKVRLSR